MEKTHADIYGPIAVQKVVQIASYDATLGDAAKKVLGIIAGYCGNNESCWPSLSRIARATGVSVTAVIKQINILEQHNYIIREQRRNKKGAKIPSILHFNCALACEYSRCPEIFCKEHLTLVVWYLVTLSRYIGMELDEVSAHLTSEGYINKTVLIKHFKEKRNNKTLLRADSWAKQKEHDREANVSSEDREVMINTEKGLREYLTTDQITNLSLEVMREVKGMSLEDSARHQIKRYRTVLQECQSKSLGNSVVEKVG
ncbi:MAG: helix-turn-helix domain-containing protein [Alphaproteobacteria bacterium]